MPRFKYNGVDFVAAERLALFGRCEFQHMLRIGRRPAIKSEDNITREVVSDTARANADALGTQVLEVAYAGIGASADSPLSTRRMFATEPSELTATHGIA